MNPFRRIVRQVRLLVRRRKAEAEMAEEMRFHLEQRAAEYREDGLPAEEARYAAERKFGNVGRIQEESRDTFSWGWFERAVQDVRFALRQLVKSPGFTMLAVVTLALGIGANSAMFSVFYSLMFEPLRYPNATRLERIFRTTPQTREGQFAPADVIDLRREMQGYGEIAAYQPTDATLSEPGQPAEMAPSLRVTSDFFSVFGVQPILGRDFRADEEVPGSDRVVVITHRLWQDRFGGRPDIVGHRVRVDGEPHMVIGVLPETFYEWRYLAGYEVFRPLALPPEKSADRTTPMLRLIGRRGPGVSPVAGAAFVARFGARLAASFPGPNAGATWRTISLQRFLSGENATTMFAMLIGLSAFVLLIACSNLANLLLARTIARAREFAVRAALGASRLQLLRPLIVESLLLALAGGGGALLVVRWAADWMEYRSMDDNGEHVIVAFDWHVFVWTLAAALVTAIAFGLAPALFALRLDLNDTLKSGARGTTGGRGHQRFRQILIVNQFALAMVLLAGAAVFVRGLNELNTRRAGWSEDRLVTGTLVLPATKYATSDQIAAFERLALERLETLPGVGTASLASFTPFFPWSDSRKFVVQGQPAPRPGEEPLALVNTTSPRYFETVGTRLLAGRVFDDGDTVTAPKVFVINQSMAKALFGEASPLGRHVARVVDGSLQWGEVVGVVADVASLLPDAAPVKNQLYQPIAQEPRAQVQIIVRADGVSPTRLVDEMRSAMTALDPDLPIRKLQPAGTTIARANYQLAVLRDVLSGFAIIGLGLATLGIYGVIARTTAQRTSEFAIRLALGACVRDITRLVLTSGIKLALMGAAIGVAGAIGVVRVLASGFPSMRLDSPLVMLAAVILLIGVALVASWLPARRAGRVNAMEALRAE